MNQSTTYPMRIDLNVLNHLGINLYSNVPAVLSEVVANSWDADAENVNVLFDQHTHTITIQDDGIGMTRDEVIERFLVVGYRRREDQRGPTAKKRNPMGRKGIGKLSLFSIAEEITVETTRNGQKTAFRMNVGEIRDAIKKGEPEYHAPSIPTSGINFQRGTRITIKNIKRRQNIRTVDALRTRIARRFSIIGPAYDFKVKVNGQDIKPEDRGYYDKLQYIWTYGDFSSLEPHCKKLEKTESRKPEIVEPPMSVSGWIGTVQVSGQLKDSFDENLNRIAIFVRGKSAQEDILGDFSERGLYATYLIGELRVDDLDTDHEDDTATTSRQRILEDDPRYIALKKFLSKELKHIQSQWTGLRLEEGVKRATAIPAVQRWLDRLPRDYARQARNWLGKMHRVEVDNIDDRKHLIKHAILAFEFFKWNQNIDRLNDINDENLENVIELFNELDGLEASLYGQIIQERMKVIHTLQEKVDSNQRERVIQEYIFDHLWLLDPGWERVESTEIMETRVASLLTEIDAGLSDEEKNARIDIQYRKTAGKHVIVELKRPNRTVGIFGLAEQIKKYRDGMQKILDVANITNEPIEIICLLGKLPSGGTQQFVEDQLALVNARYVTYDELLKNASNAYQDYTKKAKYVDRLGQIIKEIEDYGHETEIN